jgi:outer membrane murein-binding lipoprotein Lpp
VLTNSASDAPDLPGKSFSNATLEQCKKVCNDQDDNCAGFLYDRATQTCFPKSGDLTRNVNPQPDADLYVRDKVPAKPPMGVSQNTVAIDTLTYGAYPQGSEVDANAKYGLAGANSTQRQHLDQLQTRLSQLASQIQSLTGKFEEGTQETQDQGTRNNAGLGDYVDSLKETNAHIQQTATLNQGGLNNILQDSDVVVLQKNYDYLFWSILATGTVLISLTMN